MNCPFYMTVSKDVLQNITEEKEDLERGVFPGVALQKKSEDLGFVYLQKEICRNQNLCLAVMGRQCSVPSKPTLEGLGSKISSAHIIKCRTCSMDEQFRIRIKSISEKKG